MSATVERLRSAGEIGGRTVQIVATGAVECATYEPAPLADGEVRVRTARSAISPGTEMTFLGRDATNVHLRKHWNVDLRLFEPGPATLDYPVVFGYRAAGQVVESRSPLVAVGARVWGNWRHTEFTTLPAERAAVQLLPEGVGWDDGVDIGQVGPICLNAALEAGNLMADRTVAVFGAGPIGLITAQMARALGAARVVVVDRVEQRLAVARDLGLEGLLADASIDVAVALRTRDGVSGVPVAFECTGAVAALREAIRVVPQRGMVIAVGFYQGGAGALDLADEFHHNAVRIVSAQIGIGNTVPGWDRRRLQERTLELLDAGSIVLGGLPRAVLPVDRVADAFDALRRPDQVLQVALSY